MIKKIITEIKKLIREYDPFMEKCKKTVLRTNALISKRVEELGEKHGVEASYDAQAGEIVCSEECEPFYKEVANDIYQLYYELYNDLILILITDTTKEN